MDSKAREARLLDLIREKALRRGEFILSSGQKSDYYLDGKQVTLDGEGALLVAEAILDRLAGEECDAVGGMAIGADPIAGAVAAVAAARGRRLKAFIVRRSEKGHGTKKLVEGPLRPGERCVVVEDVCSTGASAWKAVEALHAFGAKVVRVVAIVDREMGAERFFADRRMPYTPLYTKTQVLG